MTLHVISIGALKLSSNDEKTRPDHSNFGISKKALSNRIKGLTISEIHVLRKLGRKGRSQYLDPDERLICERLFNLGLASRSWRDLGYCYYTSKRLIDSGYTI